jgi:hypothetical protein
MFINYELHAKLTKMTRKRRLPPGLYLGNPPIQHHDRRNTPHEKNRNKEHDQAPGRDSELGAVERLEREPGTYVHEACTVQEEVNDR